MHGVFAGIGRFSVRFRWFVIVGWVALVFICVHFFPSLASVTNNNNTDFLPSSAPSSQAAQLATPFQAKNVNPIPVVIYRSDGKLTPADDAAINQVEQQLAKVPDVKAVRDLGRSATGRPGEPSGQAEQLVAQTLVAGGGNNPFQGVVDDLRSAIAKVPMPAGLQGHLAGDIATQVDQQQQSGSTGNKVEILSVVFILILLLLIFRALLAPLITVLPPFIVVSAAGPLVAEASKAGLHVSQLAQLLMLVLVLGAGTDYGLFLVFRVREQLREGLEPKDAVVEAVSKVGESITFSAGTVIAALLSLLAATFGIYSNLGVPLAIGIALMLIAGLTLLPALLAIFGRAVFWPSRTRAGTGKAGVWGRLSARIVRRPATTLLAGVIVFGGLAFATLGYSAGGFGGSTAPPTGSDSAAGTNALTDYFPSASANPTNLIFRLDQSVWTNPQVLAEAEQQLKTDPLFTTIVGPLNPNGTALTTDELVRLHSQLGPAQALSPAGPASVDPGTYQAYRATAQLISADGQTVMFDVGLKAGDPGSTEALNAVPAIRTATAQVATSIGATANGVSGEAPGVYDVSNISNNDLKNIVPLAIVIIGVLLALVMRSLVAPLYLIVSVGLSYLAALGLSVLLFIKLGGTGGLSFILPFLMFLFLLALGEDYNILVMTRIREEAHRYPLRVAVTRALGATGTTVTSAGLVLAGTFAVFALAAGGGSGGSQFRDIGIGLSLGILMDTFLVRTLLVPSTVVLLGRWNWWPSRMSRVDAEHPEDPGSEELADAVRASD